MRTTGIPESACTACGKLFECATHEQARRPIQGDVSICIACGHIMLFDADMRLRNPTTEEARDIAGDPRITTAREIVLRMRRGRQ